MEGYSTEHICGTYTRLRLHYVITEVVSGYEVAATLQMRATQARNADTYAYPSSTTIIIDGRETTWNWTSSNYPYIPADSTAWVDIATATEVVYAPQARQITLFGRNDNMDVVPVDYTLSGYAEIDVNLPAGPALLSKIYGSVSNLTTLVDKMYGPVRSKAWEIQKIYGSVDNKTKLVYLSAGEIPRPGLVKYYPNGDTTQALASARIITQTDLDNLSSNSNTWTVTLEGQVINNTWIKEVTLPTWATGVPDRFLIGCTTLDTLNYSMNLSSIGDYFLSGCSVFNQTLDMTFIENIGDYFLSGCSRFNQTIDLSNFTSIPDGFLSGCSLYDKALDLSTITEIGDAFLQNCSTFNKALDLSNIETIGNHFLSGCSAFNQDLVITNTTYSIDTAFMYNCKAMTHMVTFDTPASIIVADNNTFATNDSNASCYTTGIQIAGMYVAEWKTKFADRDTTPYRKLIYGPVPILYQINPQEQSTDGVVRVEYGVSSWDITGVYTSGEIKLYRGTSPQPTNQIDTYNAIGINIKTDGILNSNTAYYYRVLATNDGNLVSGAETSMVTRPAKLTVSETTGDYINYNHYQQYFDLGVPANGGAYAQQLQYRLSKVGYVNGQPTLITENEWHDIISWNQTTSGVQSVGIVFETDTEYQIEFKTTTDAGSNTTTHSLSAIPTHIGPQNVVASLGDNNSSVQTWLSTFSGYADENWFISGQSIPHIEIPVATAGTTTDGADLSQYNVEITSPNNGVSTVIIYDDTNDMVYDFDKSSIASRSVGGDVTVVIGAQDSLQAIENYTLSGKYMTWEQPTLNATANRTENIGGLKIVFSGLYSGLHNENINSGNDLNHIKLEYRVLDYAGVVITDWTRIRNRDFTVEPTTGTTLDRIFSGNLQLEDAEYAHSIIVEIRAEDHFGTISPISIPLTLWEASQVLSPANYEIELWDWKTSTLIADLSYLVVGELNIEWELNDIEDISFDIDLGQFEKKCSEMGVDSEDLLKPYAHDIRIRRNGVYIVGGQIVETTTNIRNNPPITVSIRATGFLNLLKDQYILNEAWSGYTYAEIARKLVSAAQRPDCLIKNPTCDIDTSYWLAADGVISSNTNAHSGARCLLGSRSGTGWITVGSQMTVDSGTPITIDVWVKGQNGADIVLSERQYITDWHGEQQLYATTGTGNWQHIQVNGTTWYENSYFKISMNRTDSSTPLYIDDCYIYAVNDDATLCDLKIPLGTDTASLGQDNSREFNYELQNVKDALIDLTSMEEDNFDFEFMPDRTFNIYARKGSDKLNLEVGYPGNVDSVVISKSAANLANKIIGIGSGIGDERLQVCIPNNVSREIYGTREAVSTNSNISLKSTLLEKTIGTLYDRKDVTNLPKIIIKDGSINPSNVQTGDTLLVTINNSDYVDSTTNTYRVMKIKLAVDEEATESMTLTLSEPTKRPEKQMVRYIRDSMIKTTTNNSCIWEEIQALMLVGSDYLNIAQGCPVYGSTTWFASDHAGLNAVDGNINTWAQMQSDGINRVAITIDLGDEYPLDYVKIWHYWPDGRKCIGEHLSVGTTLPDGVNGIADLETTLWSYGDNEYGNEETANGRKSGWIQEENVVWGDGDVSNE